MTEPTPLAPVVLQTEVTIDGRTYAYRQSVARRDWETIERDPILKAHYEQFVRDGLGRALARSLAPPVTVLMPTPLDEAVMQRAVEELEAEPLPSQPTTNQEAPTMPTNEDYPVDEHRMSTRQQPANPEHYEECPVNTGDGPACRCDAITAEDEAYYAEPTNMAALENGGGVPIW